LENQIVKIPPPKFDVAQFQIRGIAPYVHGKFTEKAKKEMHDKQAAGHVARKGQKRDGKNFQECYEQAMYKADGGWPGIPTIAFRKGMVSACRLVGYAMTIGKLSIFIEPDGFESATGTPLIKITKGEPHYFETYVKNATGVCDLRVRPMWDAGWEATIKIRYDADQMTLVDITNLLSRVGLQVGIGSGRPDSPKSVGMGWGLFEVLGEQ
jgi:hypothetical protein